VSPNNGYIISTAIPLVGVNETQIRPLSELDYGFFRLQIGGGSQFVMLSLGDCQVVRSFIRSGAAGFEPFSLSIWTTLVRHCELAVDIGSYTGVYSLVSVAENPGVRVVAFEASPITFGRLVTNILANRFDGHIAPLNLAASNRSGHLDLTLHGGIYTMSSGETLEPTGQHRAYMTRRVDTVTADEILDNWRNFFPYELTLPLEDRRVGLIKIDVEGHEKSTLSGLKRIISRDHPTMLIEVLVESDLGEIVNSLSGYDAFWVDERGSLQRNRSQPAFNALFVHCTKLAEVRAALAGLQVDLPDSLT